MALPAENLGCTIRDHLSSRWQGKLASSDSNTPDGGADEEEVHDYLANEWRLITHPYSDAMMGLIGFPLFAALLISAIPHIQSQVSRRIVLFWRNQGGNTMPSNDSSAPTRPEGGVTDSSEILAQLRNLPEGQALALYSQLPPKLQWLARLGTTGQRRQALITHHMLTAAQLR